MGRRNCVRDARELRIGVGEYEFQRTGMRPGGVGEPASCEEGVLRAGGEDFEQKRAGGHVSLRRRWFAR